MSEKYRMMVKKYLSVSVFTI